MKRRSVDYDGPNSVLQRSSAGTKPRRAFRKRAQLQRHSGGVIDQGAALFLERLG
jgi:hypothetical protein